MYSVVFIAEGVSPGIVPVLAISCIRASGAWFRMPRVRLALVLQGPNAHMRTSSQRGVIVGVSMREHHPILRVAVPLFATAALCVGMVLLERGVFVEWRGAECLPGVWLWGLIVSVY